MVSLSYCVTASRSASSSRAALPSGRSVAWSKLNNASVETRKGMFCGTGAGGVSATGAGASIFGAGASTTGAGSQSAKREPGCQERVCQHSPELARTGLLAESVRYPSEPSACTGAP
jgi:hypothetical protein